MLPGLTQPAAEAGQQQALGEQLPHEAPASRTQRGADGDLLATLGRAGQQEIGHVGAGDEQHEADRPGQRDECGPHLAHGDLAQVVDHDAPAVVGPRVLLLEPRRDGVHLAAGLLDRHAGSEPADHVVVMRSSFGELLRGEGDGDVQLGRVESEAGPHDPDHGVRLAVERERRSDQVPTRAEPVLPEPVADDDDAARTGPILLGEEGPAVQRSRAEEIEQVGGDQGAIDHFRVVAAREREGGRSERRHPREGARLIAPIGEIGRRNAEPVQPFRQIALEDHREPVRIDVGQRREHHGVHDAEDRAVGPDAQRQRQHGDRGEARALEEHPKGEPRILEHRSHRSLSSYSYRKAISGSTRVARRAGR